MPSFLIRVAVIVTIKIVSCIVYYNTKTIEVIDLVATFILKIGSQKKSGHQHGNPCVSHFLLGRQPTVLVTHAFRPLMMILKQTLLILCHALIPVRYGLLKLKTHRPKKEDFLFTLM